MPNPVVPAETGPMDRTTWLYVYASISLVSKLVSFLIGYLLFPQTAIADLIDLGVAGTLLSIAFVHVLPRAEDFVNTTYPFASLVAVIVFVAVTIFTFVRDSLALMDENILTPGDLGSPPATARTTLISDPPETESAGSRGAKLAEIVPTVFLFVSLFVDSVATDLVIAITETSSLTRIAAVQLSIRFLEFIVLAKLVKAGAAPKLLYWGLGIFISVASSVVIAIPLEEGAHKATLQRVSGCASAVVLGLYMYFGSLALNSGLADIKHSRALIASVLIVSFAVSAGIPAGIR
jgi:hypothetical protein